MRWGLLTPHQHGCWYHGGSTHKTVNHVVARTRETLTANLALSCKLTFKETTWGLVSNMFISPEGRAHRELKPFLKALSHGRSTPPLVLAQGEPTDMWLLAADNCLAGTT